MWTALTSCCSLLSSSATDSSALSFCTVCVTPVGEHSGTKCSCTQQIHVAQNCNLIWRHDVHAALLKHAIGTCMRLIHENRINCLLDKLKTKGHDF